MYSREAQERAVNHQVFKQGERELYGYDAELAQKHADNWDAEKEKKALDWIYEMTGDRVNSIAELKSGVTLCKLINRIRPGLIPSFSQGPKLTPLHERDNLKLYAAACVRLGVPSAEVFHVEDLYEQKYLTGVLSNLFSLGRVISGPSYHCPKLQVYSRPPSWWGAARPEDAIDVVLKKIGQDLNIPAVDIEKMLFDLARERVGTLHQLGILYDDPVYWQQLSLPVEVKKALARRVRASRSSGASIKWTLLLIGLSGAGVFGWAYLRPTQARAVLDRCANLWRNRKLA